MALIEPLSAASASKLIRAILESGIYVISKHAAEEMAKDGLATADCVGVLRAGVVQLTSYEGGTWRYRVQTLRISVVIAFRSPSELVVVTAWKTQPRRGGR